MKRILFLSLTALLLSSVPAFAAPQIEISLSAEIDVEEVVAGKKVVRRVAATEVKPGQTIFYRLRYANTGDQAATQVQLNDPIPAETSYLSGSAFGEGTSISFSADEGESYQEETRVTYKIDNADGSQTEKSATPDQYTHIRWTVETIPPGGSGEVGFSAQVK